MESFLQKFTEAVMESLRDKLIEFAKVVSELPDSKVSQEDVLNCWNKVADLKVSVPKSVTGVRTVRPKDPSVKCEHVFKMGKSKGTTCGKSALLGEKYCSVHFKALQEKKEEVKEKVKCAHVLESGEHKGENCSKSPTEGCLYCKQHHELHKKRECENNVKKSD